MVTSVGMFDTGTAWVIPKTFMPLTVAVGPIAKKPRVIKNSIVVRDILHLTVVLDHDVIDGAPAARFVSRLKHLMESGFTPQHQDDVFAS